MSESLKGNRTQEAKQEIPGYKVIFRIMRYFNRKAIFILGLFLAFLTGVSQMFLNITMGDITTAITTSEDFMGAVKKNILKFIIFAVIYIFIWYMKDICSGLSNPRFLSDIRTALFKKYMELDISYYDQYQTGSLLDRITTDCTTITSIYMEKMIMMSQHMVQTIAGIVLTFIISWQIGLATFIAIPLCMIVFFVSERMIGKQWAKYNDANNSAGSKAEEVISSFRTVKSFDNELKEADKYRKSLNDVVGYIKTTSRISGIKDGLVYFIIYGMIVGFLYFCVWIIARKPSWGMENGDIMTLFMVLIFSALGVYQSLTLVEDFRKANASARKILEILETPTIIKKDEGKTNKENMKGKIEFKNVSFRYMNKENYAIKNLNFTISPGETVAFVGESGCGKSTTLQLLQRFYDIESGEICIDDENIKNLSPRFLRSQISVVPQSSVLFSMSIKDNIRYSKPSASDDEVTQSSKSANSHDFIMNLPDNYQTMVTQTSLSGGQKQRVCIARAILANTPILMLDEATSALDTESERLVQESLETVRKGKTAIIVAHRLSTVINADKIFVFKEGSIVEEGKHEELLKQGGYYAQLIKNQLQKENQK